MASDLTSKIMTEFVKLVDIEDQESLNKIREVIEEVISSHMTSQKPQRKSKATTKSADVKEAPATKQRATKASSSEVKISKQTGYQVFVKISMPELKEFDTKERMSMIGGKWQLLSAEQKTEYNDIAVAYNNYVTERKTAEDWALHADEIKHSATTRSLVGTRFEHLDLTSNASTRTTKTAEKVASTPVPVTPAPVAPTPVLTPAPVVAEPAPKAPVKRTKKATA